MYSTFEPVFCSILVYSVIYIAKLQKGQKIVKG